MLRLLLQLAELHEASIPQLHPMPVHLHHQEGHSLVPLGQQSPANILKFQRAHDGAIKSITLAGVVMINIFTMSCYK